MATIRETHNWFSKRENIETRETEIEISEISISDLLYSVSNVVGNPSPRDRIFVRHTTLEGKTSSTFACVHCSASRNNFPALSNGSLLCLHTGNERHSSCSRNPIAIQHDFAARTLRLSTRAWGSKQPVGGVSTLLAGTDEVPQNGLLRDSTVGSARPERPHRDNERLRRTKSQGARVSSFQTLMIPFLWSFAIGAVPAASNGLWHRSILMIIPFNSKCSSSEIQRWL